MHSAGQDLGWMVGADMVVANHVIEHIANDNEFLCGLRRLIRESGFVCIATPNAVLRLKPGERPFNPEHVREYSISSLLNHNEQVFHNVKLYGLYATPEITAWYNKRTEAKGLARLVRYAPEWIKAPLRILRRAIYSPPKTSADVFEMRPIGRGTTEQPLDLVAICRVE
jgi:hypothetical protein